MVMQQELTRASDGCARPIRTAVAVALALLASGCAFDPLGWFGQDETPPANISSATVINIGDRARSSGDLLSAATFYRRAHELDPGAVHPLIQLGDTLIMAGATRDAEAAYGEALKLAPGDPDALRGRASALVGQGRAEEAIGLFEMALAKKPEARTFRGLGVAHDMRGEHDRAATVYRQGLALAPQDLGLRNNLGLSEALAGRHDLAISILRAVANDPNATSQHRLNLALVLGLAGRAGDARQVALIDLDPVAAAKNVAFYSRFRAMSQPERLATMLGPTVAPSLPTNPVAGASDTADKPVQSAPTLEPPTLNINDATPAQPPAGAVEAGKLGLEARLPQAGAGDGESSEPWIQLGVYKVQKTAEGAWARVSAEHPDLTGSAGHVIKTVNWGDQRGTWYYLRHGPFGSLAEAKDRCAGLQAREVECFALRTRQANGETNLARAP
jgi:Flp pilus assembly protein TadD